MNLKLVTPPATQPIANSDIKPYLRIDFADLDAVIDDHIKEVVSELDGWGGTLNRAIQSQAWELALDGAFPDVIRLPLPPLSGVTSIKYLDFNGTEQTLDSSLYDVLTNREPGEVVPAYGKAWPSVREGRNSIKVVFACGYDPVPDNILSLIKLKVRAAYDGYNDKAIAFAIDALHSKCRHYEVV